MKTKLYSVALCVLMLFAAGCGEEKNKPVSLAGDKEQPEWVKPVDYDMTISMTVTAKVDLSLTYAQQLEGSGYKLSEKDLLAAFAGNRCLGVAQLVDGLFYLYIINPNQEGGAEADNAEIHLKYYSAELKNIFVSEEAITFLDDIQLGTVREPYTPKFIIAEEI